MLWPAALPWATLAIVVATVAGIAAGRWPFLRADRTTIALLGAAALMLAGSLTLDQVFAALDLETIMLLFSMMAINGCLYLAGFFGLVTRRLMLVAHTPRGLLAVIVLAAGVLSALFLNDTIVLILTPIVVELTLALRRNPVPYLLGVALAANVGSTATVTGNPQNIIIGSQSGIAYASFAAALAPTAMLGLGICWLVIVFVYRDEFRHGRFTPPAGRPVRLLRPLLRKTALVVAGMLAAFLAGVPVPVAAFLAAAALLATRRIRPERVYKTIDWGLLVFFAGLFVVTHALETQGLTDQLFALLRPLAQAGLVPFGLIAVVLSNLISNVPAVLLLQSLVPAFADQQRAWLMLAAASTLAGNLTLLGSVANLIMAEIAGRWGVRVTFRAYLQVGVPVTILTLLIAFLLV
jgi:Na+/H+ antiporter NhaD/arsenite permease-like protein